MRLERGILLLLSLPLCGDQLGDRERLSGFHHELRFFGLLLLRHYLAVQA